MSMKKRSLLVICLSLALLLLFSATGFAITNVSVTKLALDDTTLTMIPGKTLTVTYTVWPGNATDKKINWSSSNSAVATVSSKGEITAVKEGSAVITAKTSNKSVFQKVNVTVIEKIIKLDMFSQFGNQIGTPKSWGIELLKEKVGVELNYLASGDNIQAKYEALLAGGELPDVILVNGANLQEAIRAKMLVSMDDPKIKAKLPNVFKVPAASLQYARDFMSFDTGKLYCAPCDTGKAKPNYSNNWGPSIRWDLYKKIGMPKLQIMEDYISVLKKMMAISPKNKDGLKNYGISIFKDWDGQHMFMGEQFEQVLGCSPDAYLNEIDYGDDVLVPKCILDEDSAYMRGMRFFFKANQEGVLDPDSMTQNWSTLLAKATEAERVFFSFWGWCDNNNTERNNATPPRGMMFVLPKDAKPLNQWQDAIIPSRGYGINASSKNIDAVCRYIDFAFSWNGIFQMVNGPRGIIWDVDKNGTPYVTKQGWAIEEADKELPLPGGGKLGDGVTKTNLAPYSNGYPYASGTYDCTLNSGLWDSSLAHTKAKNKLIDDYKKVTGYENNIDMMLKTGRYTNIPIVNAAAFVSKAPDDIQAIINKVGDICKTDSWLMVYAKDQAEFNKIYDDMIAKANGLGLKKVNDWSKKAYIEGNKVANKYKKLLKSVK